MLLDCITTVIFEEYEAVDFDERDLEDTSRVSGFLKNFIETGVYRSSKWISEATFQVVWKDCYLFWMQNLQMS